MKKQNGVSLELKNMLQKSVQNKENQQTQQEYNISPIVNLELIENLTENKEITQMLVRKTTELVNLQIRSSLELGKILVDVFNQLAKTGSKYEGLYEKWLLISGINKKTAIRYRKRYEIYDLIDKKEVIATMSQKYIDLIYSHEDKDQIMKYINEGMKIKDIISLILEETPKLEVIDNSISFNFSKYNNLIAEIDRKIDELEENKKIKLLKYLSEIEKILK